LSRNRIAKWKQRASDAENTERYARVFFLSSNTHAQPAMSSRKSEGSGVLIAGGGGGGGGT
jgi:hypothetical protein